MLVNDDVVNKNLLGFELAMVLRKFLKFVYDNDYCKYYEMLYILFHTGVTDFVVLWSVFARC